MLLVPDSSGSFQPETNNQHTVLRRLSTDTNAAWEVIDRVGKRCVYGQSATARLDVRGVTRRWLLEKCQDTDGNGWEATYVQAEGELPYLSRTTYTTHTSGSTQTLASLTFELEARPEDEPRELLLFDVVLKASNRLKRIKVSVDTDLYSQYDLEYAQNPQTHRSFLMQVTRVGASAVDKRVVATLDYGFRAAVTTNTTVRLPVAASHPNMFADVDGDGDLDVCHLYGSETLPAALKCTINDSPLFQPVEVRPYFNNGHDDALRAWVDINNDGRADYCRIVGARGPGPGVFADCNLSEGTGIRGRDGTLRGAAKVNSTRLFRGSIGIGTALLITAGLYDSPTSDLRR